MPWRPRRWGMPILASLALLLVMVGWSDTAVGLPWSVEIVDASGYVGPYTSIALDSADRPHISYFDDTNDDLKYARWTGSAWVIETVDATGTVGEHTSIALDSADRPHISYTDSASIDLKYARWTGSAWSIETVDVAGAAGYFTSIALDSADRPHISYYGGADLRYARWTGTSWSIETVDAPGSVGWYTSLALDSADRPHISYFDNTNDDLKYARWTGVVWNIETVDSVGAVGEDTGIALDSADSPHISYYDATNADLKYARWNGTAWNIETVDSTGITGGSTSIALDSQDRPQISYYMNADLRYARWTGSAWSAETADAPNDVGRFSSIALDAANRPHISYLDWSSGDLKYAAVTQNAPPAADFFITPPSGDIFTTFSVNASTSSDLEDSTSALEVRWDWEDDGTWDTAWSITKTAQHQYGTPGIYTIRLEVRDTGALTDQTTGQVQVNNTSPTASFTVTPSSGTVSTTFAADASASSDLEDPVPSLEVRWDWEDDATWDTPWSTTKTAQHQYPTVGTYTIRLEVRDTGGSSNQTTRQVWVNNTAPTASFTVSPSAGDVATTFTVDASPSSDLEDPAPSLEVRWDWEDDATWDTPWSTTKTAQHQYPTVGTYTIRLELRDSGGMTDQAIRQAWVNNTAPTVSFTVTPTSGDISTIFAVDASSSSDLEDATSALQVRWDWEDDGVWDTAWSTTKTAQHQYGSIGYYTIRLEVRDSGGLTNEITREVWVNSPPTASFTVSTVSGDITTLFAVDASASTDVEDPPAQLEVRWDWEDDATWDTPWSTTKTAQHQYPTVGTYTIRLEVRDTGGLTNWAAAQVWVNNTSPAASFTVTPAVGDVSTLFIVDASLSSDLEDATPALEVRWDWEDDGTWDTAWSTTKTAQHQYGALGAYIVRLGVRDTGGLSSQTTRQVWVNNTPPIASFAVAPLTGDISTTFAVDASSSSDLEDATSTLEVRWDWEDDGVWDTSWSTTKTAQHQYLSPGTYTIRLEARDAGGLADQTTRQVWVNNTPPTASFTISPPAGDISTTFTVDASSSTDLEDSASSLEVRWDWEDDGVWDTSWSTIKTAQHQYTALGVHTVRVEVRDIGGLSSQTTRQVWVNNTSPSVSFVASPSSGNISTLFTMDALTSDLEDPPPQLEVRWDWEDDGSWDSPWSTTKTAQHQFATPGTYTIRLEVRDTGGLTSQTTRQVWVNNTAPVATFTMVPTAGNVTTAFLVDAAASSDLENSPLLLEVRWDWEDDGVWDTSWSTTKTAQHQYPTVGAYTIRLEVRDSDGLSATATRQVSVLALPSPPAPPANLTAEPGDSEGSVRLTWTHPDPSEVHHYSIRVYDAVAAPAPIRTVDTTGGSPLAFTVTNLQPGKVYWFTVAAVDDAGRASDETGRVTGNARDGTEPREEPSPEFPWWILLLLIVVILAAILTFVLGRRRRKRRKPARRRLPPPPPDWSP